MITEYMYIHISLQIGIFDVINGVGGGQAAKVVGEWEGSSSEGGGGVGGGIPGMTISQGDRCCIHSNPAPRFRSPCTTVHGYSSPKEYY